MTPLNVIGKCVAGDEELFANMEAAISRGLPEVLEPGAIKEGVIALCASGPSIKGQLEVIREMKKAGTPIVGIKDTHDWLILSGITPDYGFAIDPQAHRFDCFKMKGPDVHYMIASQCNASMFDHLADCRVTIWHPYITKGQKRPAKRMTIGGGTTSGLRALSLFYVLGWRHFALFGFDSCLDGEKLRVNGSGLKPGDSVIEVMIEENGKTFYCNPSMALQAQHFQEHYEWMPDANFYAFGEGLIQAIIRKRTENAKELEKIAELHTVKNNRVSFIHRGDASMASFRYRSQIPAREIGATLNDLTANTLVFSKPHPEELMHIARAKARGARVVVDFCDDHFDWMHYGEALRLADTVTVPTEEMAKRVREIDDKKSVTVIPDPYEWPLRTPHCAGANLLWFGHAVNRYSLERVLPEIKEFPILVISNFQGAIQWSPETMAGAFVHADICILPATETYKSCNRAIEAIRQGLFVVAEPHPSLNEIPGIWIGNIKEGIEWARLNLTLANERTLKAQKYVTEKYSPQTVADAWKMLIQPPTTWEAEKSTGTDG